MRILIVSQYFPPEPTPAGDLAVGLRDMGNEVTVLTAFPAYPRGQLYPGYRLRIYQRDTHYGIPVVRVPFYPGYGPSPGKRSLSSLSFAFSGSVLGPLLVKDVDAILVFQVSPLTMAIPAMAVRAVRGGRLFLWVQDLWPETLESLDIMNNRLVLRGLGALMRAIGQRCDRVLVQSEAFISPISRRGIPRDRIEYVPNWAEEIYQASAPDERFRWDEGLADGFTVVFAGNIGLAQNLHVLIEAAESLQVYPEIRIVIIGDGSEYLSVVEHARARKLNNVVFKGRQPVERMPKYFGAADVLLVQLKENPVFSMTVPSKLQSYMACGRPVLAALNGAGAEIVLRASAGLVCQPESPTALRDAIVTLWRMPHAERDQMGRNARRYYERHFDRRLILCRLHELMGGMS